MMSTTGLGCSRSLGAARDWPRLDLFADPFDAGETDDVYGAVRVANDGRAFAAGYVETDVARQLHAVAAVGHLDRIDVERQSFDTGRFMGDADRLGQEGEGAAVGQLNDAATGRFQQNGRAVLADEGQSALGADAHHRAVDEREKPSAVGQITCRGALRHRSEGMEIGGLGLVDLLQVVAGALGMGVEHRLRLGADRLGGLVALPQQVLDLVEPVVDLAKIGRVPIVGHAEAGGE